MDMPITITIVIPALNEEGNLLQAVRSVQGVLDCITQDYEIIIFNDGSTDQTRAVAESEAHRDPRIRVIHHAASQGYGYCYRQGVSEARKEYISVFPGDNDMSQESFRSLMEKTGEADVVFMGFRNHTGRSFWRKFLSKVFACTVNLLSGLKFQYYTGGFVCKTSLVRSLSLESNGLAIGAECLVKLLRRGYSHCVIGLDHVGRKEGQSKALSLKSLQQVVGTLWIILKDVLRQGCFPRKR